MTLVKHDKILSLFNQAYYCTNYCVFSVGKCYYKDLNYCFQKFYMTLNRNKFCHYSTKPIISYTNYCVFSV